MDNINKSPYAPNFWKDHVWVLYPTQYAKYCSNILNHSKHNVKELQDNTNSIELDRSTKSYQILKPMKIINTIHHISSNKTNKSFNKIHWNWNTEHKLNICCNNGLISHKMSQLVPHSVPHTVPHGKNVRRSNTHILKFMQEIVPTFPSCQALFIINSIENHAGKLNHSPFYVFQLIFLHHLI